MAPARFFFAWVRASARRKFFENGPHPNEMKGFSQPPHPLQKFECTHTQRQGQLGMGMGLGPNFSYNILNPKWTSRAQLRKLTKRVQPISTNGMLFASILMFIRSKFAIRLDPHAQSCGPDKSTMPSHAQTPNIQKEPSKAGFLLLTCPASKAARSSFLQSTSSPTAGFPSRT